nr:uncharacterized protein LOC102073346 isoform X4 [Zonotrichia albicollis]
MRRRARLPGDRLGLHRCLSVIAMPALLRPGPAAPSASPTCPSRGRQRVALPSHRRGAAGAARERSGNAPRAGTEPGMHRERRRNGAGAEREPGLARRPPRRGWREAAEKGLKVQELKHRRKALFQCNVCCTPQSAGNLHQETGFFFFLITRLLW